MQETQYLITETQLKSLIAQVKQNNIGISVDEMIFKDFSTLDAFFDSPPSDQVSSKFLFPQGLPFDNQ